MPIPSFTGKQSLGTQIVFIKDGNIFGDGEDDGTPIDIGEINNRTKKLLGPDDAIEYSHVEDSPDPELQRFLDEKD
jgi:hypothetical protein